MDGQSEECLQHFLIDQFLCQNLWKSCIGSSRAYINSKGQIQSITVSYLQAVLFECEQKLICKKRFFFLKQFMYTGQNVICLW